MKREIETALVLFAISGGAVFMMFLIDKVFFN